MKGDKETFNKRYNHDIYSNINDRSSWVGICLGVFGTNRRVHTRQSMSVREVCKMALDVRCEVRNCVHNRDGKACGADEIFVVSRSGKKASDSKETDCKTFEPASL